MPSDKVCCVPGCKESGGMHAVLHGFPNPEKERNRFNTWLYAIGGNIIGLENERILKYRRVCHSHFEDKYRCRYDKISNIAVPTLNMPDRKTQLHFSFEKGKPMHDVSNVLNSSITDPAVNIYHEPLPSTSTGIFRINPVNKENIESMVLAHVEVTGSKSAAMTETIQMLPNTTEEIQKSSQTPRKQRGARKLTRRLFMSDNEVELRKKIVAARVKISKLKNKNKKRLAEIKAAKQIGSSVTAIQTLENSTSTAKLLMSIQCREDKKNEKGRRFTLKEKIVALSLLKQSPKGYKFFRNFFILPAPQTLMQLVQRSNLKTGINKNIFQQLKNRTQSMTTEEKLCVLLFDEVSLKAHINYSEKKDRVIGFVDNGQEVKPEFADHAQVFMVRGLIKNYKQPVAYTFSASATKGPELAREIREIIVELQSAGLIVVATVCDQGTNNRNAMKLLLNETRGVYLRRGEKAKDNFILINNQEICPIYDPPHLLKGMRNNLITKKLEYIKDGEYKVAQWSHLQQLHIENPGYKGIRLIPKLTENHINPEKMNKMKVKYASQIFSRTVASNMGYLADKGILPLDCKQTADFLLFMDNIFDSVNGSLKKNVNAKPLLGPATPKSLHFKTWAEARQVFSSMKFKTPGGKSEPVPTIANWVWTLNGLETLIKNLKEKYGITSVWLRHLNQDPLENFFGAIRSHGCRNVNPTCDQFEYSFATLLINNLTSVHTRGKNCENDFCDALQSLVIDNCEPTPTIQPSIDIDDISKISITPLMEKKNNPTIIAALEYVSGYVLKKVKTNIFKDCLICNDDFSTGEEIEYIKYREYSGRRWLCSPSNNMINLISNIQDIVDEIGKNKLETMYLSEMIKTTILVIVDFNFINCTKHKDKLINYIIKFVTRFLIHTRCKNINKILTGRRDIDDHEDKFQVKARMNFKKCFKRKK